MLTILFILFFLALLIGVGWLVVSRLDNGGHLFNLEKFGISFVIGSYIIYLFISSVGLYRLDVSSVVAVLVFLLIPSILGIWSMPWQLAYANMRAELDNCRRDKSIACLWLILVLIVFSSLFQGLAPPNDYDALAYHLALPRLDIEAGNITLGLKTDWPATFFPALGSHLTRVSLLMAGAEAAQVLHGIFGLVGAIAIASLVLRAGETKKVALFAAQLFLSVRMVIWQMGTVETDVPVASLAALTLAVYLVSRYKTSIGLELIIGLLAGCTILMKYHGLVTALALAPLFVYDALTGRKLPRYFLLSPCIALLTILPHLIRNYLITDNPIYPLFTSFFDPSGPQLLVSSGDHFGTGRGLMDFITSPWNIFIFPTHYFDGMVIGAPYFLVFCPLIIFEYRQLKKWLPPLAYASTYFLLWFLVFDQPVRFLAPIMPILSAIAAAGVFLYWRKIECIRFLKMGFVLVFGVLVVNQVMFIGIYSIIRLPVAIGMISPSVYHNKTPTMGGAYYSPCKYIESNLKREERYFILGPYVSYYCPQAVASLNYFPHEEGWWMKQQDPPKLTKEQFIFFLNKHKFRYFLVQLRTSSRRAAASKASIVSIEFSGVRFGKILAGAFSSLEPLIMDKYSAVFDGYQVLEYINTRKK